jgi:hypothetical protein
MAQEQLEILAFIEQRRIDEMPKLGLLAGMELVEDLEEFHALLVIWPSDVQQLAFRARPARAERIANCET